MAINSCCFFKSRYTKDIIGSALLAGTISTVGAVTSHYCKSAIPLYLGVSTGLGLGLGKSLGVRIGTKNVLKNESQEFLHTQRMASLVSLIAMGCFNLFIKTNQITSFSYIFSIFTIGSLSGMTYGVIKHSVYKKESLKKSHV